MRRRVLPVLFAVACAAAVSVVAGCNDDEPAKTRKQRVEDLELPTSADAEAAEKLRDAQTFLDAKKPRLAEPLLRRVLELKPDDPRAAGNLARCLADRGEVAESVALLRRALAAAPRSTDLHALLVRSLEMLGDPAATEQAARSWTQVDSGNADAYYKLGSAAYAQGRFTDAIAAFRRAENLKSARADIRSALGLAFAASGDLVKAEAKQRDAIDRQPGYAEAWFRLGDVIFRRDPVRAREAAEAMAEAVKLEPGNTNAHLSLFRIARLAKVDDDDPLRARGEQAWETVLRLHGRAQAAAALGDAAHADEKTSEYALREQTSIHPDDPAPRLALARFLHADRRWDEAVDAYRRAIASGAPGSAPHVHLAAALASHAASLVGRDAGGAGSAGAPATADTDATAARIAERLRAAESELKIAAAAAASATPPDTATSLTVNRLLAWVLLLAGRDKDAMAAADAALAFAPDDVLAKKLRALARMHLGEIDEGLNEVAALGWL